MTTRVAWLSALIGLAVAPPLFAQTGTDAQLERAAERRFRSAEQFYAGGRYGQALRDYEAILDTMPGSRLADDAALRLWAWTQGLRAADVRAGRVTVNHDDGSVPGPAPAVWARRGGR